MCKDSDCTQNWIYILKSNSQIGWKAHQPNQTAYSKLRAEIRADQQA
jgi:hypothetical protein